MAQESNVYVRVWQKYMPAILHYMRKASEEAQSYPLSSHEFTDLGKKGKSAFKVSLEFRNGTAVNDKKDTVVAKELKTVLLESPKFKEIIAGKHFKLSMGVDFVLHIEIIQKEVPQEA